MKSIFQFLVNAIGLPTLLIWVWDIVKPELIALAQKNDDPAHPDVNQWDNKAVEFLDKLFQAIIKYLNGENKDVSL